MRDPTTIDVPALLELVQCPPIRNADWHAPLVWWEPKDQASPSALQQYAGMGCPRSWGHTYLEGRRDPKLEWSYARQIPEPPKPAKGCSAIEKVTLELAKKAWNKVRRPALGTEAHAILSAYMTQNAPRGVVGAWHPPMVWREIDWHSDAGKVARPAADVLPDPRVLAEVHTELAAEVEAPAGWVGVRHSATYDQNGNLTCCEHDDDCPLALGAEVCGCGVVYGMHWPRMPGFYDLITVERVARPLSLGGLAHRLLYRLWDFKTTSSFDWAKTEEELREDPQILLYALHAMQTFGLQEIECSWIYLLTDPASRPRAYVVSVLITRAEAEAAVLEMAETAAEVVGKVRLYAAGKLRVIDLEMNVAACTSYGGCVYHISKAGPCDAHVSPGKALRQKSELDAKIRARKSARKETEQKMALSFDERKKAREAAKAAEAGGVADAGTAEGNAAAAGAGPADGGSGAEAGSAQAAGGGLAPESASSSTAKPKGPFKPKAGATPFVGDGAVTATVDGFAFSVPPGTALGKQLAKAAKGLQAAAAAFEGE